MILKKFILFFVFFAIPLLLFSNGVKYMWSGAVTSTSVKIVAWVKVKEDDLHLIISESPDFVTYFTSKETESERRNNYIVSFSVSGLRPNTKYFYTLKFENYIDSSAVQSFITFINGYHSFSFVIGACSVNSDHPVFETMKNNNPLFYINMGDLHYSDVCSPKIEDYYSAYQNLVFSKPAMSKLLKTVPLIYTWDDHDFCGNNSNAYSIGRSAARQTYQDLFPHYTLPAGTGDIPIYQAFTVGRLRFIITDLRSERTWDSMMGEKQRRWFENEVVNAQNSNLFIVWITSVSFSGNSDDNWGGYSAERKQIANFFRNNGIKNMMILSGDAHMLAIDNGYHSDFSGKLSRSPHRYPIFQAAALNAPGSFKGGTFTEGVYINPDASYGQFGLINVTDNGGNEICIQLKGMRVDKHGASAEIIKYSFCRDIGSYPGFKIFPNPAKDKFHVVIYNATVEEEIQISLFDYHGSEKLRATAFVIPGENDLLINLNHIHPGVYIVYFKYNGIDYHGKLVITL